MLCVYIFFSVQGVLRDEQDLDMFDEDFKKVYSKTRLNMFDEEFDDEDEDENGEWFKVSFCVWEIILYFAFLFYK